MKRSRTPWWPMLGVAVLCSVTAAAPSNASTRNYLTVEGQVFDHLGSPLPGTWVFCLGSRRASVPVDSLGHYRLEIPGATLEELERAPLKIRVQARRKGYRFALSNGAPELGLEMRVVKDESALSRLRVRSNDSATVAAVASSVVLDANPRALVNAVFVGSQGAQYDTPPVPLDNADEITLAGNSPSIPELQPAAPAPRAASAATDPKAAATAMTKVVPEPKPQLPPGPPGVPPNPAATPQAPSVTTAPAQAAEPPVVGPRTWNAAGSDRGSAKPRVVRPGRGPDGEPASGKSHRKRHGAHDGAAPSKHPAESPRVAAAPSSLAPATSDTTSAPPSRTTAAPDPNLRPVLQRDMPMAMVAPGRQPPVHNVPGAPGAATSPRRGSGGAVTPMCDCTIRGTVEVQWDRPLTSRTEVVVAVEDAPDATTSAELFMGSPRAFEIHPAPCGVHRLLLWTRSRQRFVLVSSEPRVVCTPGGVQQMRLVMEPVARWGAPQ